MEMDFGEWEGQSWTEIPRDDIDRWAGNPDEFRAPGGESLGDVFNRGERFLSQISEQQLETTFVMTHGGVIRCLVAHALGLPLKNAVHIHVGFGGVSVLRMDGESLGLECLNV